VLPRVKVANHKRRTALERAGRRQGAQRQSTRRPMAKILDFDRSATAGLQPAWRLLPTSVAVAAASTTHGQRGM